MPARILVLAGVNGGGKSSVGGAFIAASGGSHFDPDRAARRARVHNPSLDASAASIWAWNEGYQQLQAALANDTRFAFETTLGGDTITETLLDGARKGAEIAMWFVGLASPEVHLARVASRVAAGGHDIPEAKIRERYRTSRENLIRLLPSLSALQVYDNSAEADPKSGQRPEPLLLLTMRNRRIVSLIPLDQMPDWAKPIAMAAIRVDRGEAP